MRKDSPGEYPVTLAENIDRPGTRLSIVRINNRPVAYPQDGRWLLSEGFHSADGVLKKVGRNVCMLQDEERLEKKSCFLVATRLFPF